VEDASSPGLGPAAGHARGILERMRGDGLRAGPLASRCEEPSPRVAAAWI
jgi:hypothetical protein